MRIARIIMNMKESFEQIYHGNPWENHKKSIFQEFETNRKGYFYRIESIVNICQQNRCEIIIFPACTFIYKTPKDLNDYLNICQDSNCVVSGFYKVSKNDFEDSKIIKNGKIIDSVDATMAMKFSHNKHTILMAISSTIKEIKFDNIKESESLEINYKNCLIFDLGHHQYKGRYILTLKSVFNTVNNSPYNCNGLFLSFWKFNNGKINSDWFISAKNLTYNRINNNHEKHVDFIDIINV
jgi:hypothetical protein